MKKNTFKVKTRGIQKTKIKTMAGPKYLEKADKINKEIAFINRRNASAYETAGRFSVQ